MVNGGNNVIPLRWKWKLLSEKKLRENKTNNQSMERRWSVIYRSSWSKDITCKRPVPKPNSENLVLCEVCVTSPSWITALLWRRGLWNPGKLWCDEAGDAVGSPGKAWLWVITIESCGIAKTLGHRSIPGILSSFYSYCTQSNTTFQQHCIPPPPNHSWLETPGGIQRPGTEEHDSLSELSGRLGNIPKRQTRQDSREEPYLFCYDHLQI